MRKICHFIVFNFLVIFCTAQLKANAQLISINKNSSRSDLLGLLSNEKDLTSLQINNLSNVCQIWGFLKYYHPNVYSGKFNWDEQLLNMLPKIINAKNINEADFLLTKWIDTLGYVKTSEHHTIINKDSIRVEPDYGTIFEKNNLSKSLQNKLKTIINNYNPPDSQYYIKLGNGTTRHSITADNEITYSNDTISPSKNLLSLFRFWSLIQYFYPYRNIIDTPWIKTLSNLIPIFHKVKNEREFQLACLLLASSIDDSHSYLFFQNKRFIFNDPRPLNRVPFQVKFIENKLVITDYYIDTLAIKDRVKIGDIIEEIDDIAIDTIIKRELPYVPAANMDAKLRNLARWDSRLLRGSNNSLNLTIKRNNNIVFVNVPLLRDYFINQNDAYNKKDNGINAKPVYTILNDSIGYIYPTEMDNNTVKSLMDTISHVNNLIIDFRVYPSRNFLDLTSAIDSFNIRAPYALYFNATIKKPGTIIYAGTYPLGRRAMTTYNRKKIILIVNSTTQSRGEFQAAVFRNLSNTVTLGNRTAGAAGSLQFIPLAYGLQIGITEIGLANIDSTDRERLGIGIDVEVRPTINGIKQGKDELLEKAVYLLTNKNEWDKLHHY